MDRYITARQLGEDLKQKVYSDAMDRGHTHRPHVGEIYGVGDFVFIPDIIENDENIQNTAQLYETMIKKMVDT